MQANQGSRFSSCALLYLPQAAGCCASMAFCLCAMWLCLISGMLGSYPTPLKAKMHIFLCCSSSQPAWQSCCCCFWAKLMKCLPTFYVIAGLLQLLLVVQLSQILQYCCLQLLGPAWPAAHSAADSRLQLRGGCCHLL